MLREIHKVRQNSGEPRRRWFTSGTMDLVVWESDDGNAIGFQFCYDKGHAERAVTWTPKYGFSHMAVDDGEGGGALRYKSTPMLVSIEDLDNDKAAVLFGANSVNLPQDIVAFVIGKITEHGTWNQ